MRSSACDTLSRSCARRVLCWLAFPSASALGSTDSAAGCPALFVGFPATIAESDFPRPFIIGYGSSPSRCGPEQHTAAGQTWDLPVPVQGASAHARFFDHAGPFGPCDGASETWCLPRSKQRRHPGIGFRGSMAGLCPPLPTLRRRPYGEHLVRLLANYRGIVQCDGYAPYKKLPAERITVAFCWSHLRREFFKIAE